MVVDPQTWKAKSVMMGPFLGQHEDRGDRDGAWGLAESSVFEGL